MANWQADEVLGEVRVGHEVELHWPTLGVAQPVRVVAMDPGRQIGFEAAGTRLELTVHAGRVHLVHEGLSTPDEAAGTAASWRVSLALLAHYLERHEGSQRQVHWFVRETRTTAEAAHVFFTAPAALGAWLTTAGGIGDTATPVRLKLTWGASLTGQVLCCAAPRDVAVSWREEGESALVLRTLPSPRRSDARLLAAAWSCWGHSASRATTQRLAQALQRLGRLLDASPSA